MAEISEGMQIDVLRARFMARLIEASIAQDTEVLAEAESLHLEARSVVDARHDALWDPDPERLLTEGDNHTLYDFGYLLRAEDQVLGSVNSRRHAITSPAVQILCRAVYCRVQQQPLASCPGWSLQRIHP